MPPLSSGTPSLSHPPQPAGWRRNTERMDKVGGALPHSWTYSSHLTPVPTRRGSLFLSGHFLANLTAWWGEVLRVGCCSLISQTDLGIQGRQCCLPGMRVIFQMLKGQSGLKHGNRSKRQALKSASTDLGTTDVGE